MALFLTYAVLFLTPAAAFYGAGKALDWLTRCDGPQRGSRKTVPARPNLERLVGDLRRLEHDYQQIERSDLPARASRLRAVILAYDETLCACCLALDLPRPDLSPLDGLMRLQTEAALAQRGLVW